MKSFCSCFLFFLFTSCVLTKVFLRNDQIPNDFGKDNKTILIVSPTNDRTSNIIINAFQKYYKGSFTYVGDNKKATNLGYTFNTYTDYNSGSFSTSGRVAPTTDTYFGVTDLETKKVYKMLRFGNTQKLAKCYVKALEIVRLRNQ